MLLEASEEGMEGNWDGGRIVWSVRYAFDNGSQLNGMDQLQQRLQQRQMQQHHHHHHAERRKLQVRLEIQKDDIQAVLPISKVSFLSEVNSNFLTSFFFSCRDIYVYEILNHNRSFLKIRDSFRRNETISRESYTYIYTML